MRLGRSWLLKAMLFGKLAKRIGYPAFVVGRSSLCAPAEVGRCVDFKRLANLGLFHTDELAVRFKLVKWCLFVFHGIMIRIANALHKYIFFIAWLLRFCFRHRMLVPYQPIEDTHMSFFQHLICADCGSDDIVSNGDNDCCAECGSHDYTEIESDDDLDPIAPLVNLFEGWKPIFGGKQ